MSHRFLYQNLLGPGAAIAPSSVARALVGGAVPRVANGAGSAVFSGAYTGQDQEVYTVQIETAGQVGAATFKWRKTSTGPGAWEASGIATALTDTALEKGVKVRFANGASSPAFQAGDRWQATASQFRSPKKLYDLDPNTAWRSGSPPLGAETLVFDLLTPQEVKAAILHLHNISSGATVKIQADRVPVQASVQADGVVTSFVSFAGFAGFGSLVGTTSDWAFGFKIKTPADVTTLQYFISDANDGGAAEAIDIWLSGGSLTFLIYDGVTNYGGSFAVQANTVYRVLGSFLYSDKKLRLYKDGALQATSAALAADIRTGVNFTLYRLGDYAGGSGAKAGLNLCDVVVYGEYLDAAEALAEFNGTFTPGAARKGWWKMDEGTGTSLADSGPSGYTGVMNGGLAWNAEGAPILSEAVAWGAGTMHHYLTSASKTFRHWRLLITGDAGNPDGYIEIGEMYLGGYFEPEYGFAWRSVVAEEALERGQETESGAEKRVLLNRGRRAVLPYAHVSAAQKDLFRAMFQAVKDKAAERNLPLFAHLDVGDAGSLFLATLAGAFSPAEEGPDDYAFELELTERLK